ncbi:acetylcholine receptor subunit gamma-like isoform X1 [Thrips palmi]|uniref:Acetylcholine receptor subunit gamma-like isoform X1 n=1 Tax=Thrips palmi TaxID=161013 RepID=A0A6P8Z001_THRPL|nr:acetylcholine receptor subunit gamma-like isoform X1 [Thrips palmi]
MDSLWTYCAFLAALAVLVRGEEGSAASQVSHDLVMKLLNHLAEKRDPLVRPDLNATNLDVTLGVKHLTLDERYSTISVNAWIKMEWRDTRLAWADTEEFKPIMMMHLESGWYWKPDFTLKNSLAGKAATLQDSSAQLLVYPDGRVTWTPSAMLESFCDLDLRRWPFEQHACTLQFGSWTLDRDELTYDKVKVHLEFPGQTGEYVVDRVIIDQDLMVEQSIDSGSQEYDQVDFIFLVHREPGTYRAIIFTPAAVVIILCLSTFWLPPRAGEKVVLGGVNAMLICFFLIYFAHSLPILTDQTPFIVMFYSASLYLVSVSLVASVLVLNISRQPHAAKLPWALMSVLTGPCGRALLLTGYIEQIMGMDVGPCRGRAGSRRQEEVPVVMHEELTETLTFGQRQGDAAGPQEQGESGRASRATGEIACRSVNPNMDWLLLGAAIDRVLFVVYSLLFVCLAIAFHL